MAGQRVQPERRIVVYKFWIQPTAVPPQVWETAQQMQILWNHLVDLREAASERIKSARLSEPARQAVYADLEVALRRAADQSPLPWDCRQFVLKRFTVAVRTAIRRIRNGVPPQQAGFPKRRGQLQKIAIPHRYKGGGVPIAELFQSKALSQKGRRPLQRPMDRSLETVPPSVETGAQAIQRCWLKPVAERAYLDNARPHKRLRYTEGAFALDDAQMPFRALLHRQIPDQARVKNAILIGQHSQPFGWAWALALTCTLFPDPAPVQSTGRCCGLVLGWRRFPTYLRIGLLVDTTGNVIELRLPLAMPNRRTRQFNQWIGQAHRSEADRIYESWDDLRAAASRENAGEESVQRRIESARARLIRRRHWLYQNLAAWLAKSYDTIAWGSGPGVKAMAEKGGKTAALKRADRYRQIAAIGEFKDMLRHQVKKRQARLIDGGTVSSTVTCFSCGRETEGGPKLRLQCPQGHRFDQDENAARWLLSKIDAGIRAGFTRRQGAAEALPSKLEVPEILKSVAVSVQGR